MHSNQRNTAAAFAAALQEQFDAIDGAYARGEFGNSRRDEYISNAFFRTLENHYSVPELAPTAPVTAAPRRRSRPVIYHRVSLITGPDTMMVKRGRREFEIGLCSVRVPVDLHEQVAAALCELLQFERVKIRVCCRDSDGLLRGVVERVDPAPILGKETVNAALIAAGLGHAEARCRKCDRGKTGPDATALERLRQLLSAINEQAERRFSYLMQ